MSDNNNNFSTMDNVVCDFENILQFIRSLMINDGHKTKTTAETTDLLDNLEPLVDYKDDDPSEDAKLKYNYNDFKILLKKENPVAKLLIQTSNIYEENWKLRIEHIE
jgi:hypothetical protein